MSKPGKDVGNIDMNFEAKNEDDVVAAAAAAAAGDTVAAGAGEEKPIEFTHEGKKIYTVKNGAYTFYDDTGKPLSDGAVDNLNQAYQEFPEFDPHGRKKDGPVLKFPVDANGKQPGQNGFDNKVAMTAYKQRYKGEDGSINTLDYTVQSKHEAIIKVLRGEIGHNVTKPDEKAKAEAAAKPTTEVTKPTG